MSEIYIPASSPLVFEEILQSDWEPVSIAEEVGCFAGDTIDILFSVTKDNKPVNLTGCSGDLVVVATPGDSPPIIEEVTVPDGDSADFPGDPGFGFVIDYPSTGSGYVRISDVETALLVSGMFYYEIEFCLNGNSVTVQFGTLTVNVDTA